MMLKHKTISTAWIIHLFALLHVLAVIPSSDKISKQNGTASGKMQRRK